MYIGSGAESTVQEQHRDFDQNEQRTCSRLSCLQGSLELSAESFCLSVSWLMNVLPVGWALNTNS